MTDVSGLGQDCSNVYGSLLLHLAPYFIRESQFNMTDLFQNTID